MRCYGDIQTLKNTHGEGYLLQIKIDPKKLSIATLKSEINIILEAGILKEEFENMVTYSIPQIKIGFLGDVFKSLYNLKERLDGIEEYSFSQTTFEQVFLNFAKQQEEA